MENQETIPKKKVTHEFLEFLKEYKVFSLAIAFIMGGASTSLINSLVKNIIMPIIEPLMSASWQEAIFSIGPIHIVYGAFLADMINFLILSLLVFIITKKILKIQREEKK